MNTNGNINIFKILSEPKHNDHIKSQKITNEKL